MNCLIILSLINDLSMFVLPFLKTTWLMFYLILKWKISQILVFQVALLIKFPTSIRIMIVKYSLCVSCMLVNLYCYLIVRFILTIENLSVDRINIVIINSGIGQYKRSSLILHPFNLNFLLIIFML